MRAPLIVSVAWDGEASVWTAVSQDVPGLATEAGSLEALVPKLEGMISELLDANGYTGGKDIPFELVLGK